MPKWIEQKLPDDKLIFCYAGTLGFANAMESLFDVLASDNDVLNDIFFLVVGDGYLKDDFEEKVKLKENVFFTGKIEKVAMPSIIKNIDVCFIAWHHSELYKYGVSANKYFDYFAASKPVLSAQTGIKDPVVKSGAGKVVPNTKDGILEGIRYFVNMNALGRKELGNRGYEYVIRNHVYDKLSKRIIQILNG